MCVIDYMNQQNTITIKQRYKRIKKTKVKLIAPLLVQTCLGVQDCAVKGAGIVTVWECKLAPLFISVYKLMYTRYHGGSSGPRRCASRSSPPRISRLSRSSRRGHWPR